MGGAVKTWHHLLQSNQILDLSALPADGFRLVMCKGRSTRLHAPTGWSSVILVLAGSLGLASAATAWTLSSRQCQVWVDGALRLYMARMGWWLCVAAPADIWKLAVDHRHADSYGLLPHQFNADHRMIRAITRTFHTPAAQRTSLAIDHTHLVHLRGALCERQQALQAQLQRCSGRTALRRHQTLLRLLRVQHLIRHTTEDRLDLQQLAASANYSPTHLIRAYRDVFDETPSEFANRLRQQRAWAMVRGTALSIGEISQALGFDSESAFCRAFKQAFGLTTGQARRLETTASAPPSRP